MIMKLFELVDMELSSIEFTLPRMMRNGDSGFVWLGFNAISWAVH